MNTQQQATTGGLLVLAMMALSAGTQLLLSGGDLKVSLTELGVGVGLVALREIAKRMGDDL